MNGNLPYWFLAVAFAAAFGWAGSGDYDYRCDQAHKQNKKEACTMVASKDSK